MLDLILKFGRAGTTAAVTVISVLISVSITLSLDFMLRRVFSPYSLTFSIVAPLLIAPWATWIIVGLVIRINQLEHEQRNLATYDALTGVLMRRAYLTMTQTCLEQAIEKISRSALRSLISIISNPSMTPTDTAVVTRYCGPFQRPCAPRSGTLT